MFFDFHVSNKTINQLQPGKNRLRNVFTTAVWHPFYILAIKGFVKDVNVAYQTNELSGLGILFCQILCQANNKFTSSCGTLSDSKIFGSQSPFIFFFYKTIFSLFLIK